VKYWNKVEQDAEHYESSCQLHPSNIQLPLRRATIVDEYGMKRHDSISAFEDLLDNLWKSLANNSKICLLRLHILLRYI
jgi:hypothetical protein